MSDGKSSQQEGSMVGLICDDGLILATSSSDNLLYHLEDHIYCCAPRFGIDREKILAVGAEVDSQTRERGEKMTVGQVRDMLCQKYKHEECVNVLLGGQDPLGLHIYSLKPNGGSRRVIYAAKGKESNHTVAYLGEHWNESLKVHQAEQIAKESLQLEDNDYVDMCSVYKTEHRTHMDCDWND
ncbi:proteasome subunit beta type-2 [Drosophila rhopaloa]|uniref:Proteasome subunit beta type-2 n=1 Tax=Drosophila rhopaloa TaxID=1041015 RepID=A0A6P4ED08_DRORH|nr:proteasome subunit beta type-2 [Drosophila rhopaloa]